MGRKGLLMCVCQGTCPSFHEMDIFAVGNAIRQEGLVDYVAIHPQLCSSDGETFLTTLLQGAATDQLYIAGCAPVMQVKMFRDSLEAAGFEKANLHGADIRNLNTQAATGVIRKILEGDPE